MALVVLILLPSLALAVETAVQKAASKAFSDTAEKAELLSQKGDYGGAADLVARFLQSKKTALAPLQLKDVTGVIDEYNARAAWSKDALTSAKSGRALLKSLLFPDRSFVERARLADARVAALFAALRKSDKEFRDLFGEQTIKVSVTAGDGISELAKRQFTEELSVSLKTLGFKPSEGEASDAVSFELASVPPIDVSKESLFAAAAANEGPMESCGVKAIGRWRRGGKELLPTLDLSTRAVTFTKSSCETQPAKKAGGDAALKLMALWFKAHPTPL